MNSHHKRDLKSISKSLELFARAKVVIPSQTQTFSKGWTQFPFKVSPIFANASDGGFIFDVDGNKYIDWPMALGPLVLGHNYPSVVEVVKKQLSSGIGFSLPHEKEVLLAERLVEWFPYADMARFGKNGSDATTGAIRVARAFTGKDIVLCCGYHGWHDWFIGTTTRSKGVPQVVRELTVPFPYNDVEELERLLLRHRGRVAAIIMEPVGISEPNPGYLEKVRQLATDYEAILIFDECWTGFRLHLKGAYGKYGVAPDLACFGKALGNGIPISAVVGRADIMETFDDIFFSSTFGGDVLGLTAALEVLKVLEEEPVLDHIELIGSNLLCGVADLINKHELSNVVSVSGYPGRHAINFERNGMNDLNAKTYFQQEAIKQGILATAWHAPCYCHTADDVSFTLEVYDLVFQKLKAGIDNETLDSLLEGTAVKPVFREL